MASKKHASTDTKSKTDKKLDEALRDSFPASDPISFVEPAADDDTAAEEEKEKKDKK